MGMILLGDQGTAEAGPGHDGAAGTRLQLLAVSLAAGALGAVLGLASVRAALGLVQTPAPWWGMSQLGSAVLCLTSGAGALGALWHTASAVLALVALRDEREAPGGGPAARGAALALLDRWGAPMVRRIAAGALIVGLSSSPAMAATAPGTGDDLGWQPTSSATQDPSGEGGPGGSGQAGAGEAQPAPPGPPPVQPPDPQPQAPAPALPAPQDPGAAPGPDGPGATSPAPQQDTGAPTPSAPAGPSPSSPQPPASQDQEPGGAGAGAVAGSAPEGSTAGRHVVVRGESLWSITAALLPRGADDASIARAWPALYRANARVIGPDPSLITPGTVLTIPTDLPGAAPATSAPG
ncbi:LysM peptidoglycan-binding domain-containing protein [Actinomyces bowdenii]|uniref:LysM peptidoglycan-binding domain-containing protein n=1 Tax=Actinomyces bowdenii TaxID=131109 RepID=UPI001FBA9784|nr:LysM domain-containing protein [Actinomyces bowdenii]